MKTHIVKKISYITILSIGNSALNFLFQIVVARSFGTGVVTDAFFLAFSIPEWVMNITVFIIPVIIIPFISGYIAKDQEEHALSLTTSIMTIFVMGLVAVVGGLYAFNGPISRGVASNLGPQGIEIFGKVSLFFYPVILFTTMSALLTGLHYSYERYLVPNISPLLQTAVMIGGVLLGKSRWGIQSAAVFMLIGSICRYLFLVVFFHKRRLFISIPVIKPEVRKDVKEVIIFMVPLLIGQIVLQSYVLVERYIASLLTAGSITYLYYAGRVTTIFKRVASMGTNTVIFPRLSKTAAVKDDEKFQKQVNEGMCFITFISLLIVGGILLFSTNIVYVLFTNAQFQLFDAVQTGLAIRAMCVYILSFSLVEIINSIFYSLKNTKVPLILGIASFAVIVALEIILSRVWAHIGIALASATGSIVSAIAGMIILGRQKQNIKFKHFFKNLLQNGISIAAALGVVLLIILFVLPRGNIFFTNKLAEFGVVAGLWIFLGVMYLGFNYILKNQIVTGLLGRFLKKPEEAAE